MHQDVGRALRSLVREWRFFIVAALTLALGLGGAAALFAIVDGIVLRGLPLDSPDRIVSIEEMGANGDPLDAPFADFQDFRSAATSFVDIAAYRSAEVTLKDSGLASEHAFAAFVSANTFSVLTETPMMGRGFSLDDDRPGAEAVVVLGADVWRTRYAAAAVLGRVITVDGVPRTVIGVMKDGFKFPLIAKLWLPLSAAPDLERQKRGARAWSLFGRMADGVNIREADAALNAIMPTLATTHPATNSTIKVVVTPFTGTIALTDSWSAAFAAVGLLLVIASANVGNLLLVRATRRTDQVVLQLALGATRWRLLRQFLLEGLVLAVAAGLLGFALSRMGVAIWVASLPQAQWPYWYRWTVDGRVLGFLAAATIGSAVLFAVIPGLHLLTVNVHRLHTRGLGRTAGGMTFQRSAMILVVIEAALTLALVSGATAMVRSGVALHHADSVVPDPSSIMVWMTQLPAQRYSTRDDQVALYRTLQDRLAAMPGVAATTIATALPFYSAPTSAIEVRRNMASTSAGGATTACVNAVSPPYFDTLGVRLLSGRMFDEIDGTSGHEVAIVNDRFARTHFRDTNPLGQLIRLRNPDPGGTVTPWLTVVGVAPDIRQRYFQDIDAAIYLPLRQAPTTAAAMLVRSRSEAPLGLAQVRTAIDGVDSDIAVYNSMRLDQLLAATRFSHTVFFTFFVVFGAVALVVSIVGLFAVAGYSVVFRTREIGVRMALGAQRFQLIAVFLAPYAAPLAAATLIGLGCAVAGGRLLNSLLFEASPTDPLTLLSCSLLLVVIAALAISWPVHRASRSSPAFVLRAE
jgi:predicted permease